MRWLGLVLVACLSCARETPRDVAEDIRATIAETARVNHETIQECVTVARTCSDTLDRCTAHLIETQTALAACTGIVTALPTAAP